MIIFPHGNRSVAQVNGPHALKDAAEEMFADFPMPERPKKDPKKPRIRWWRLGGLVFVGTCLLLLARWHITTQANLVFPREPVAAGPSNQPSTQDSSRSAKNSPYEILEQDLRIQMRPGLLDVSAPGQLEDALLIELRNVRLDVADIHASVLKWGGRKLDVPQVAEFRIRLRATPNELDRELASTGLVVGKYIHHYRLTAQRLEVIFDNGTAGAQQLEIDPEAARLLYVKDRTVLQFLTGAF
ncbi:MAG: hypothetical protein QGG40_13750 [Myxococcota bacterium]|nr:hypothetical protein [Myxococcota bacterium]